MKRVGFFALAHVAAFYIAEHLTLLVFEILNWLETREEEGLRIVLAAVAEAHRVDVGWHRSVGMSSA